MQRPPMSRKRIDEILEYVTEVDNSLGETQERLDKLQEGWEVIKRDE